MLKKLKIPIAELYCLPVGKIKTNRQQGIGERRLYAKIPNRTLSKRQLVLIK